MEWYPRKPQSYRNDTWGLTLAEHGAYCLLLDYYYASECPLPANDRALSSIIGCGLDEWLQVKDAVTRYFDVTADGLRHHRVEEIITDPYWQRKTSPKADLRPVASIWAAIRSAIFERDDYTCRYCGARGGKLECDHVVPVSRGGTHDDGNLVTACLPCNRSKGDKLIGEWRSA